MVILNAETIICLKRFFVSTYAFINNPIKQIPMINVITIYRKSCVQVCGYRKQKNKKENTCMQ